MNVTLAAPLDTAYFTGASTVSDQVPGLFDVALNGRPFQLQLDPNSIEVFGQHLQRRSLQVVRDQADQSDEPGENSISPEQFWRRSQQSWQKGAGQTWLDWPGADRNRFHTSKGVDCWTLKQLSLLNGTTRVRTSTNPGLGLCVAGPRLYVNDGATITYSVDGTNFTDVTGTPAVTATGMATDGFDVWTAHAEAGLYATNSQIGAATSYVTGAVHQVGYVKGRLMAATGPNLYNIVASGALPDALFTHSNTGFQWVGFANAPGFIYAAGYAGGHSEIYSITIADTGAELDAPTIAAELPEGEVVRCIYGYVGFLIVGTDKGVRLAAVNDDGSLVLGALISAPGPVRCLDGQDRFVWFGWTNFDNSSTGLGRLDLSVFTAALTPAYASDLMATAQGAVTGTVQYGKKRMFTVDRSGVWAETVGTPVTSGTLTSGFVGYDLADPKQAVFLDMRHDPLPLGGSVAVAVASDNGDYTTAGTSTSAGSTAPGSYYLNGLRGERFEIKVTLTAGTGNPPTPAVTRYTLRADVTPTPSSAFIVPLVITDVYDVGGSEYARSPWGDVAWLTGLHDAQSIFPYQEGARTFQVKMTDFQWVPDQRSAQTPGDLVGTFVAQLRHITG